GVATEASARERLGEGGCASDRAGPGRGEGAFRPVTPGMRHFFRTHLTPAAVIEAADAFFPDLQLAPAASQARSRTFSGTLGSMTLSAKPEGGHYTFVEVHTDQIGESRLDRNVKRFFVTLHRQADP